MKKLFTLLFAFMATTCAFASVQIGSLYYTLNDAEGTAYVDEDPASILPYKSLTNVVIPNTVNYSNKTYKVTAIGNNAFNGATNITSVIIPDNVTIIGDAAFNGCIKLASVILGQGIETIGTAAFTGCSKLTNVTLMCDKIVSKYYQSSAANIGTIFGEQVTDYTIGDGVKAIGNAAFSGCLNMQHITISNTVKSIGGWTFRNCWNLEKVSLPNSVTSIGILAFSGCNKLTAPIYNEYIYAFMPSAICPESVTIPEGIKTIAPDAFLHCTELQSVILPQSLKKIGSEAFLGCALTSVTLPEGLEVIEYRAFADCSKLTNINFPSSITIVEGDVFRDTQISTPLYNGNIYAYMPPSLLVSSVSIPEGIQEIAPTAFKKCSELQSIEIPNSVKKIGDYAFEYSGLKHISIGKNVSSIGSGVFFGCRHLEEIYNYATTPQKIDPKVFEGDDGHPAVDKTKCKLYVPEASLEAYKAADVWKDFGDNIIGFDPNEGIEEVLANPETNGHKVLVDGQVLILNNGKAFTLQGAQVK